MCCAAPNAFFSIEMFILCALKPINWFVKRFFSLNRMNWPLTMQGTFFTKKLKARLRKVMSVLVDSPT